MRGSTNELPYDQPRVERCRLRIEKRADDGLEHLLPQGGLGFLAPRHELRVEPQFCLAALLPLDRARSDETKAGDGNGGEQAAERRQHDLQAIPEVLLGPRC